MSNGECDLSAGILACTPSASATSFDYDSTTPAPDGPFASVAGKDALRSSRIRHLNHPQNSFV